MIKNTTEFDGASGKRIQKRPAPTIVDRLERLLPLAAFHKDDFHAIDAIHNLAVTLYTRGDLAAARMLQEEVLGARRRSLGEDHPETLIAMQSIARAIGGSGTSTATPQMVRTNDPATLAAMASLSCKLQSRGFCSQARTLAEIVAAARRKNERGDRNDSVLSSHELSAIYRVEGELDLALRIEEDLLARRKRLLGSEHPDTQRSMYSLSGLLREKGDLAAARNLAEQVLEVLTRVFDEFHADVLTAKMNLAHIKGELGDLKEAASLYREVLTLRSEIFGESHPDAIEAKRASVSIEEAMQREERAGTLRVQDALFDEVADTAGRPKKRTVGRELTMEVDEGKDTSRHDEILNDSTTREWIGRPAANDPKLAIKAAARSDANKSENQDLGVDRFRIAWVQGAILLEMREQGDSIVVFSDNSEVLKVATRIVWLKKTFLLSAETELDFRVVLNLDRRRAFILLQRAESPSTTLMEGTPCLLA